MNKGSVCIRDVAEDGKPLAAIFLPEMGMNFISYKKGEIEVIDQSTKSLFEERYAGLGAMIGPHFHHRAPNAIPKIKNESLFPHIATIKEKGAADPFSHGIGRYAPWVIESHGPNYLSASLKGSYEWRGKPLKDLEGQDFIMGYLATMTPKGMEIELSVASERESVVGLHTYYSLVNGKGRVSAKVQDSFRDKEGIKKISSTWNYESDHLFVYDADREIDCGFFPYPDSLSGRMVLETSAHKVAVHYLSGNQENSFQIWHPQGASFLCMEPLSAKDPRKPRLKVSSIKILISIL